MKLLLYIFLFTFALTCVAQSQQVQKRLENSHPIETARGFKTLRPAIQKLAPPKKDGSLWSEKILKTLKSANDWTEVHGSPQEKLLAQYYLLMYHDNHLEDAQVISIGKKLLTDPKFMEMPESVYALLALNASYRRKGFYRQQLNILSRLTDQNKAFGFPVRPNTYGYFNELALVYYNLGQYTLARNNFKNQATVYENADNFLRTSSMLNNIGLTFAKQQKPDSALAFHKRSLWLLKNKPISNAYFTTTYVDHFKNVVEANIVKVNPKEYGFSEAEHIFKKELASSKAVKEPSTTASTYQDLTNFYYQNKEFQLAKTYNDSTLVFEESYPNAKNRKKAYLLKAKIALAQNQNEKALHYFDRATFLKDSLVKAKENRNYSEAAAKFNFIKTREALDNNKKLLDQKEKANRVQLIFLIVVIILALAIGGLFIKTKKANTVINLQKNALAKGLKEKELMLDEIHHRIKNNLQVISGILELQQLKTKSKKSKGIFEESKDYLQSMALIHELLYQKNGSTQLKMEPYFKKLCHLLTGNFPNKSVSCTITVGDIFFDANKATPIALIVCELITNSLKHAFDKTGAISIALSEKKAGYILDYRDNGGSFDLDRAKKSSGFGLGLIKLLAEDLDGKITYGQKGDFHFKLEFEM